MKKSRIFIAAGACVLAITGVFATKANKKFTQVTSASFTFTGSYGGSATNLTLPSAHFTTVSTNHAQVYIGLFTWDDPCPTIIVYSAIKSPINADVYAY